MSYTEQIDNSSVERQIQFYNVSKMTGCQGVCELRCQLANAINTWEVFSMPKEDRIKLWIKHTVIYQYDNHETCIDTSSIEHSSNNSLMDYYRDCVSEIEALRRDELCRNLTLYDFVTKGNSLYTGLTDEEFMEVCRHRFQNTQYWIYPIYEDMVLDKTTETFRGLSGRRDCIWRSSYRREWEAIFHGKTVKLRIGTSHCVAVIDYNGVGEFSQLEDAFPNWEKLEAHYVGEAKLLLKKTLFLLRGICLRSIVMLVRYRDFSCYPLLVSYYNTCLSEVEIMRRDIIHSNLTLLRFLSPFYLEFGEMLPANALSNERIFKKVLQRKYILYRDIIANGIQRSFLNGMIVCRSITIEVPANKSKNDAGSQGLKDLILVPQVTKKVCDFLPQVDLLNLVLAFSISYNNPNFVKELRTPQKGNGVAL